MINLYTHTHKMCLSKCKKINKTNELDPQISPRLIYLKTTTTMKSTNNNSTTW